METNKKTTNKIVQQKYKIKLKMEYYLHGHES